jgi:hypothetical protein
MMIKVIRELEAKDNKRELLMEVDEEFLDMYRSETGESDFDEDTFNDWIESLIEHVIQEEWSSEN